MIVISAREKVAERPARPRECITERVARIEPPRLKETSVDCRPPRGLKFHPFHSPSRENCDALMILHNVSPDPTYTRSDSTFQTSITHPRIRNSISSYDLSYSYSSAGQEPTRDPRGIPFIPLLRSLPKTTANSSPSLKKRILLSLSRSSNASSEARWLFD